MRPILLEFAGLQSYREPQRLDFTDLLGGGLFGIFGPTGSGKSTILDAITLALYGSVERAQGSTRGIMNQSENRLSVKFTFALKSAEGDKQYRAERSYTRDKEGNVRTAQCRLVELTALGDVVLADKEAALTAQIKEILGLTVEDFTKAVVLPQGKFSEFLQLKGADRRAMLQRIFNLSQYGDQLAQKLKARLDEVGRRLEGVTGQQIGLGDASAEAVAAAATAADEAGTRLAEAELAWQQAEATYKAMERVWELQQQLDQVEAAVAGWQGRASEVAGQRAELDRAVRAEQVRRPLAEQAESARRATEAAEALQRAGAALTAAREAEAQAVQAYDIAHSAREQKAPALTERRHALQRAVTLEQEAVTLADEVQKLAGRVADGTQKTAAVEKRLAENEAVAATIAARLKEALTRQVTIDVPAEQRERVQSARLALDRLTEAESALRQAETRLAARSGEEAAALSAAQSAAAAHDEAARLLADAEEALRKLEAEPPASEDDLAMGGVWLARTEGHLTAVADAERRLAQAQDLVSRLSAEASALAQQRQAAEAAEASAREARTAAEAALAEARRQSHAVALVAALTPGAPCPVCGSTHHPAPAGAEGAEALAAAEAAFRQADAALQDAARTATELRMRAEAAESQMAGATAEVETASATLTAARSPLPEAWRDRPAADLPGLLESERADHAARQQAYQAWRTAVEESRGRRELQVQAAGRAASAASSAQATATAAAAAVADAAAERDRTAETAAARRADYDRVGLPDLEAEEQRIKAADAELTRLRQAIADLTGEQQTIEGQLAADRKRKDDYNALLLDLKTAHAQKEQELAGKSAELRAITGGARADDLLRTVQADLDRLETAEAEATRNRDAATARRTQAEAAGAAAAREHELAVQRAGEAAQTLAAVLAQSGLPDAAAAEAALRPAERRQALVDSVGAHDREGERLTALQSNLEAQLAGQRFTQEERTEAQARLTEARTALGTRRDEKARADQAHEVLRSKQAEWLRLEAERQELSTRQNHMTELQRLLRGNAFVEFLAEEQMGQVALEASARLGQLTRYRYALEVDSGGGFIIRDDGNGGMRRAVTTLSGGETFLTSLALALALSAQIQLRGHYPLEFFFLDEGFGTLDPELLNLVIDTLERLHFEQLHVGVISHVPELRARLHRRVIVEPAEPGGRGSRLSIEHA